MNSSYLDRFNILEIFKDDDKQKILIGTFKEESDKVVVINIIKKNSLPILDSIYKFKSCLSNLVHIEESDDDLVIVTKYIEGIQITSYLDSFKITFKHRINLAYEYLEKISKYDIFDNLYKYIFIDKSQILIKDNELFLSEFLIINDNLTKDTMTFNDITKKLANILRIIILNNKSQINLPNNKAEKILDFIDKLEKNEQGFKTLEDIHNTYKDIYIYDLYMNDDKTSYNTNNIINTVKTTSNDSKNDNVENNVLTENINKQESNIDSIDNNLAKASKQQKSADKAILIGLNEIDNEDILENTNTNPKTDTQEHDNEVRKILYGNNEKQKNINTNNNNTNLKKFFSKKSVIGFLIISFVIYSLFKLSPTLVKLNIARPVASFEVEKMNNDTWSFINKSSVDGENNYIEEFLWQVIKDNKIIDEFYTKEFTYQFNEEGEYEVVLKVKDKYNQWSKKESKTINYSSLNIDDMKKIIEGDEKLDKLDITYSNSSSIVKDFNNYRSGDYSLRIGLDDQTNFETLSINNLRLKNNPILSLWIASSNDNNIKISIKGYKSSKIKFEKIISYHPAQINSWEMIEFNDLDSNIDKLDLIFYNFNSPIWLDDIEISSYK